MAIEFYSSIDLNNNELQNAIVQNVTSDPSGGNVAEGQIVYRSDTNELKVHTGSGFVALSTTTGDITSVTAGNGLTGGGSSGDVTLTVGAGDGITVNSGDVAVTADLTTVTSVVNSSLEIGRDADNRIKFGTDNQIIFEVSGGDNVIFKASGEIEASSLDISGNVDIDGTLETDALSIASTTVSATAAELNILDGVTATTSELNILDGVTSTTSELNILDGVTSTTAELNLLDGSTAGTVVASKAVVVDSNKDIASFRNITLTGELDAGSLDVSGDADIDGTLEADAITIGGNNILTGGIITTLGEITQDTITFSSANADDPILRVKNTTNDGGGARIQLLKDRGATPSDGDEVGEIIFTGDDSGQTATNYVKLRALTADVTDGAEGGKFEVRVATHDGEMQPGLVIVDGDAEDEIDVTIGNGANSTVTIPGNLTVVGTQTVNNVVTVSTSNGVQFEGTAADGNDATLVSAVASSDKTYTLPNITGHIPILSNDPGTTAVSATVAELNIMDGVTATTSELNVMDGITATTGELNILDGVTATASELNILDGVTATASELNVMDGITATTAELNLIDGGTARGTTALADGDGILINDNGTMRMTNVQTVRTYMIGSVTETGALNSGSITSGFGAIDNGTSGIRTNTFTAETSVVPASSDGASLGGTSAEWSDLYLADGAQILFGDDQEVRITHNADTGLTFSHEASGATKPFVLTIESEEDAITNGEVIGGIQFKAGDSDGSDAILPAVGIFAQAADTFGADSNRAKLIFSVAASETAGLSSGGVDATIDMTLEHDGKLTIGDDLVIKGGGTIGGANDTDLLTLGTGILTVAGEVSMTTLDIGGTNVSATAAELNIMDGVTASTSELNIMDGVTATTSELNIMDGVTATTSELNIMDGVTATTAEINLIDGGTARGTTAVSDGDGILTNDGGTMRMTKVETFATYFGAEIASARMVVADIDVSSLTHDNRATITHNLGTADVMVQLYDKTTEQTVYADIARTTDDFSTASTSKITVDFGNAPPNDIRCVITSLADAASGSVAYT